MVENRDYNIAQAEALERDSNGSRYKTTAVTSSGAEIDYDLLADKLNQIAILDELKLKADLTETQPATLLSALGKALGVDSSTDSLQVIDYAHHEIHAGSHFKAGFMDTTMSTNNIIELLFVTPDTTEWAHWVLVGQATGAVKIELFEDTTTSSNGTAVTRFNRNRNSTNTSSTLVYHTPTITADGTKIVTKYLGSEGFKEDTGGDTRGFSEFILKQNTKYLVRLTAISNGIVGSIGGDWYEHTDKN